MAIGRREWGGGNSSSRKLPVEMTHSQSWALLLYLKAPKYKLLVEMTHSRVWALLLYLKPMKYESFST
jgi:hypothetical protein